MFIKILLLLSFIVTLYAQDKKILWPSQPDPARIEYISALKNANDFGIQAGFFSKIFTFIFGSDEKEKSIVSPFGIYVKNNKIYFTDITTQQVHLYDKEENEEIILRGSDTQNFLYPIDVVADKLGNIYVSDSVLGKIFVFDKEGDFLYNIADDALVRPVGIALSPQDTQLYVVDAVSSKVHVFNLKGKFLFSIGKFGKGDAEFNRPTFIDVAKDGNLYISDSLNHRVQILNSQGKHILSFGKLGRNIGDFASPRGIALDSDDNVYVSDTLFNTIQIFNKKGEILMNFCNYGSAQGELALPEDISISDDNTIYITDTNNMRIQVFKRLDIQTKGASK